jgi:hypothetical protein
MVKKSFRADDVNEANAKTMFTIIHPLKNNLIFFNAKSEANTLKKAKKGIHQYQFLIRPKIQKFHELPESISIRTEDKVTKSISKIPANFFGITPLRNTPNTVTIDTETSGTIKNE